MSKRDNEVLKYNSGEKSMKVPFINNLSETYSKVCRRCRERKNIESVCDFIGLKNNKLRHKCNICKKMAGTLFANLAMLLLASLFCY